jgi:hypothetical protein
MRLQLSLYFQRNKVGVAVLTEIPSIGFVINLNPSSAYRVKEVNFGDADGLPTSDGPTHTGVAIVEPLS